MSIDRNQLEADLLQLLRSRDLRFAEVAADTDLLDSGLLNSLLLTDLILHVEQHYGVQFDDRDVSPGNFRSVSAIVALVLRSQAKQQAPVTAGGQSQGGFFARLRRAFGRA